MSKMSLAIIEALENVGWICPVDLARAAGLPARSVSVSLSSLVRSGSVLRKENPDCPGSFLFKRGNVPAGFGISENMSMLDRLLKEVRT